MIPVASRPYRWPLSGHWSATDTALIIIDMQADFLDPEGYFASMGYSVTAGRAAIEPTARLLEALRNAGLTIIFTREGHRPDLSDLSPIKRRRGELSGTPIGTQGPLGRFLVRGERGWDIVPELSPIAGEILLDKPGNSAFHATDLDQILRSRGIRQLILTGVTTDVCVHSTMREANDRGYDCLMLEDCCAAGDPWLHQATVDITLNEGGIFGAVARHQDLLASMTP
ncbi:cysteine hydrolase family protein [Stutzerimonas kirkiae]|uniref:Cysteine hydrolase n=1 Tax=Stutzerimonas kirkiae TaxID=2211392 RepID=A0A4Q9R8Z4_9GAMM|nr:isochorismatase family cysteine hydrolase [Stutzerimonas kirkiae]TBU96596.1 cysteine hydrolase [Stutzerimonas kirkiae]TBV02121.1 cysteine hydrolase [Stutzerimonas kirkiae]TBV08791.1 cysteine hydrolase [Stutzerimonas kirkiae]TBV15626.1 cysteine hydrolase [Stutzerimonas kirkiae]